MTETEVLVLASPEAVAEEGARLFAEAARQSERARGRFNVALAGGSTPGALYRLLSRTPFRERVEWARTFLYLGDERCVPADDPRRNQFMVERTLFGGPVPLDAILRSPDPALPPEEQAAGYERLLKADLLRPGAGRPRFDLVILGMGEDGHTASLFPGMPALDEREHLVVATRVPDYVEPAVPRITFTYPILNAARRVMFLVQGQGKQHAVRAALAELEPADLLPARRVRPTHGRLIWLLDRAAAAGLEDGGANGKAR